MLYSSGFDVSETRLGLVAFDVSVRNVPVLVKVTHFKSAGYSFASHEAIGSDGRKGDVVQDDPGAKSHLSEIAVTLEFSRAKNATAKVAIAEAMRVSVPLLVVPGI